MIVHRRYQACRAWPGVFDRYHGDHGKTRVTELSLTDVSMTIAGSALLSPVSTSVRTGECLAITGANGSGKTTLLRIGAGLMRPTTGTVTLDGRPADERVAAQRKDVAALIGSPAIYPDMTLVEHLELTCASWRVAPDASQQRVTDTLATFELTGLENRFAHELSSGQLQLFCLAQVFVRPFSVLLLDEPEQRLDTHRRSIVAEAIITAKRYGASIALASHDAGLVDKVADKQLMLDAA